MTDLQTIRPKQLVLAVCSLEQLNWIMSLQINRDPAPMGINPPKQYGQNSETISTISLCCLAYVHIVFSLH